MPVGFDYQGSQIDNDPTSIPTQKRRLPTRQVQGYLEGIQRLQRSGLVSPAVARSAMAAQLRSRQFQDTGVVPRGTMFEAGASGLSPEDIESLRAKSQHKVVRRGNTSEWIPRDETETSGFLRFLDYMQVFNYAIAGATDAFVNLLQGEDEENNVALEFWRGLTLKDKQTFSDVFENMGWGGQDGFGYWSRETIGFFADVLFDPTTYVGFGAIGAARASASVALRKGVGTKFVRELGEEIADEMFELSAKGVTNLPRGSKRAEDIQKGLADFYEMRGRQIAISEQNLDVAKDATQSTRALEEFQKARLREQIVEDTAKTFGMIARQFNPVAWDKLYAESGGKLDSMFALFGDDAYLSIRVAEGIMKKEGLDFTFDNVKAYFTSPRLAKKAGLELDGKTVQRLLSQGGVSFNVPFGAEYTLLKAQWMDSLKFKSLESFQRIYGYSKSMDAPWLLREPLKGVEKTFEWVFTPIMKGGEAVKRAFGVTLGRSPVLGKLIRQRQINLSALSNSTMKSTKELLQRPDRSGKKGAMKALSKEEQGALYDAIVNEEESFTEWFESGSPGGEYVEKHIGDLRSNPTLRHLTEEEREDLMEIARKINERFKEMSELGRAEGLDLAFRQYYLPAQYENFEHYKKLYLKSGGAEKLSDADPFLKPRSIKRRIATAKRSEGGFGLTESRNLFGLLYGREYAMGRAQIEREFIGKMIDEFAVHPGQIDKVLRNSLGPRSPFAKQLVESVRRKTTGRDVWETEQLLKLFPEFEDLKNAIETGDFEKAQQWLEENPELINVALIKTEGSFFDATRQSIDASRAVMDGHLAAAREVYDDVVEQVRGELGKSLDDLKETIKSYGVAGEDADLVFASALSRALERRLPGSGYRIKDALVDRGGKLPDAFEMSKQGGEHAARMLVIDAVLDDVAELPSMQIDELLEQRLGEKLDDWAKQLTEGLSRGHDGSIFWENFDENLAGMLGRMVSVEAVEAAVTKGGKIAADELFASSLYTKVSAYADLRKTNPDAAKELANEIWEGYGKSAALERHAAEYQAKFGKRPELPMDQYTIEMREKVIQMMEEAKETGRGADIFFFTSSPYSQQTARDAAWRKRVWSKVERQLDRYAGGDEGLRRKLVDLASNPGTKRSTMHWRPYDAASAALKTHYNIRASRFMADFQDRGLSAAPWEVAKKMRAGRRQFGWLTDSTLDSTVTRLQEDVYRTMTAQVQKALVGVSEQAGAIPADVAQAFGEFVEFMRAERKKFGTEFNVTEAKEAMREALESMTDEVKRVMGDVEGAEFYGLVQVFGDQVGILVDRVSDLSRRARRTREMVLEVAGDTRKLIDVGAVDTENIVKAVEDLRSDVQQLVAENAERTDRIMKIDGEGYDQHVLDALRDDPILGKFFEIWDDLRSDILTPMKPEAEKLWRKGRLEAARAHAAKARAELGVLERKIREGAPDMELIQERLRIIGLIEQHHLHWDDVRGLKLPFVVTNNDVFQSWLQMAAADEFLRSGGMTTADWAAAVDKVFDEGPADEALKNGWKAMLGGPFRDKRGRFSPRWKEVERYKDEVKRAMDGDPLEVASAAAWRAAREVPIGGEMMGVERVTQAALEALEETPLGELIDMDAGFMSAVDQRAAAIMAGDEDISRRLQEVAARAYLPKEEAARKIQQIMEETAWIQALQETVEARAKPLAHAAGRLGMPDPVMGQIEDAFHAAMFSDVPTSAIELENRKKAVESAVDGLFAAKNKVKYLDEYFDSDEIEKIFDLMESLDSSEGVEGLIGRWAAVLEEKVEEAYSGFAGEVGLDLGSTRGVTAGDARLFGGSSTRVMRPESWGEAGWPGRATRRRFFEWTLGIRRGNELTDLGLSADAVSKLQQAMDVYADRGAGRAMTTRYKGVLASRAEEGMKAQKELVERRKLIERELELFEGHVIPSYQRGDYLRLTYTRSNEPYFRGLRQFDRYLQYQLLKAESEGLQAVLWELPGVEDLAFLRGRQLLDEPDAELVQRAAEMRSSGIGGAPRPEDAGIMASALAFKWEGLADQWRAMATGTSRQALEQLNLNWAAAGDRQQFLGELWRNKVNGITRNEETGEYLLNIREISVETATELENVQLRDAVQEILAYQDMVKKETLLHTPALESQVEAIQRVLHAVTPDEAEQGTILLALTGRSRASDLTVAEAAQALKGLDDSYQNVRKYGGTHLDVDPEALYRGAAARDWLEDSQGMGAAEAPSTILGKATGPNKIVSRQYTNFGNATSSGGVPLDTRVYMPEWAAKDIEDHITNDKVLTGPARAMIKAWDLSSNGFKWLQTAPFPAFHIRNMMDGLARSMLSVGLKAMNPSWNYEVFKAARGANGTVTLGGRVYERAFLREMFERSGGKVDFMDKLGATAVDAIEIADPRLHPLHENSIFRAYKGTKDFVNTIGGEVDNHFRMSLFMDNLDKGMTASEAMRVAQKFMFDYAHGLTPTERNIMRRIFPFYTFTRFNIPLMTEIMFKRPGYLSFLAKTHHTLRDDGPGVEEMIPSYIREQWRLRPTVQNGQLRVYAGQGLVAAEDLAFLGDLTVWRGGGPMTSLINVSRDIFGEVINRMNPMIKLPFELYDGRNLYFNKDVESDQLLTGPVFEHLGVRDWLQLRQVQLNDGSVRWRADGFRWHLLNSLHMARIYRTLSQVRGKELGETSDLKVWERFLPVITGIRVATVDMDRRWNSLNSVAAHNKRSLMKAWGEGDMVQVGRILDTTERGDEASEDVEDAFRKLGRLRFQQ